MLAQYEKYVFSRGRAGEEPAATDADDVCDRRRRADTTEAREEREVPRQRSERRRASRDQNPSTSKDFSIDMCVCGAKLTFRIVCRFDSTFLIGNLKLGIWKHGTDFVGIGERFPLSFQILD